MYGMQGNMAMNLHGMEKKYHLQQLGGSFTNFYVYMTSFTPRTQARLKPHTHVQQPGLVWIRGDL
jgi:hypothetical protein